MSLSYQSKSGTFIVLCFRSTSTQDNANLPPQWRPATQPRRTRSQPVDLFQVFRSDYWRYKMWGLQVQGVGSVGFIQVIRYRVWGLGYVAFYVSSFFRVPLKVFSLLEMVWNLVVFLIEHSKATIKYYNYRMLLSKQQVKQFPVFSEDIRTFPKVSKKYKIKVTNFGEDPKSRLSYIHCDRRLFFLGSFGDVRICQI